MGEPQYFPSTIVGGNPTLVDGAEEQNGDAALLGQSGGLADDRTLAELFRLQPFGSVATKAILPFDLSGTASLLPLTKPGTVQSSRSANGSIVVAPFRAIVGSRVVTSNTLSVALQNWRDIRSGIFVGPSGVQTIAITPNASGNPRWDLVYCSLTVDAPTNQVQRRVKDPSSGAQSVQSIYQYLSQPVTVSVLPGTPAATPAIPSLPADSGSTYNIALAAVRVVNGFSGASTLLQSDIRDQAPFVPIAKTTGATSVRPANGQNDSLGTYATDTNFAYPTTSAANRPGIFLPPTFVGSESIIIQSDASISGHPSFPNGVSIDTSVDWRNRAFMAVGGFATLPFWSDPSQPGGTEVLPSPIHINAFGATSGSGQLDIRLANSSYTDTALTGVSNGSTIFFGNNARFSGTFPASTGLGVYVDQVTGHLLSWVLGNPGVRMFLWLQATAQLPNY